MTQDEIIEMAKQAGINFGSIKLIGVNEFEAFAKLVEDAAFKRWVAQTKLAVEDEREACAKLCEEGEFMTFGCAAEAIRARNEE